MAYDFTYIQFIQFIVILLLLSPIFVIRVIMFHYQSLIQLSFTRLSFPETHVVPTNNCCAVFFEPNVVHLSFEIFMITNKATWTQLLESCKRPELPESLNDLAVMQV